MSKMEFLEGYKIHHHKLPKYDEFEKGVFVEAMPQEFANEIIKKQQEIYDEQNKLRKAFGLWKVNIQYEVENNEIKKCIKWFMYFAMKEHKQFIQNQQAIMTSLTKCVNASVNDYNAVKYVQKYKIGRHVFLLL